LLHEAGQRAITSLKTHLPSTTRALALDEIDVNDRRGAYLNVVDVHSGAVWASEGPLPVDSESWNLVLWELQAHGLHWDRVVLDGGAAMRAWAWLRRTTLGWRSADLLEAIPADWRGAARVLLAAWDDAVWVSSAVERYHSILRPHLAVHRTLSTEMLALIAVWHNHRVFTRGIHKGKNPLQLSGITDAPTDWLVALGYPPDEAVMPPAQPLSAAAA
jgi:hypothetical protein